MKNRNNKNLQTNERLFRFGKESAGFIGKNSTEFIRTPEVKSKSQKADYSFNILPPKKRKDSYLRKYDYSKRPNHGYLVIPDLTGTIKKKRQDKAKLEALRIKTDWLIKRTEALRASV
tara:strand:+ start:761 stop:1114 length:354 start_codon:yes stop_codon:yes gene_type:complete